MKGFLVLENGKVEKYGTWTVGELLELAKAVEAMAMGFKVDFGQPEVISPNLPPQEVS